MPLAIKYSDSEYLFGIALLDPYLFALTFWEDDLNLPCTIEQKIMLTDISRRQLWCTGRKILKTLSLERDVLHGIVLNYLKPTGSLTEAMFVTPRDSHLVPTRDRIFSKINNTPFFSTMIREKNKSGGGAGVIEAYNGFKWHFRIEGLSGLDENMAGIRANMILGDEMAYGNRICHQSRLMTAYPEAKWKYCGVPNGVRDSPFFDLDTKPDPRSPWSRHKYSTFVNPRYADPVKREELVQDYGGVNTQGYITQVLGEWGDEAYSSFPPGSVAIDHDAPKVIVELTEKQIESKWDSLNTLLYLPQFPNAKYCIGVDFGYSPDPTEIVIAYTQDKENRVWRQLARIRLVKVKLPTQSKFLGWLISSALGDKVLKLSTDNSLLIQDMGSDYFGKKYESILNFANPGGSTVMTEASGAPMLDATGKEVKKRNKQYLTDELKVIFHNTLLKTPYPRHLWLCNDVYLQEALTGMNERKTDAGYTVYETSKPEEEHCKDALLYLVAAIIAAGQHESTEDWAALAGVLGWVGDTKGWVAPWA